MSGQRRGLPGPDSGAEEGASSLAAETERVMAIKSAHEQRLLAKPNVVGVGVGFRQKGGRPTRQVALVVMVRQKVPEGQLAPADRIPASIEGVPVDVQEVGEITAC